MALHFLKCYCTEEIHASLFGVHRDTFRSKSKLAILALAKIDVINIEERHIGSNINDIAKLSLDATDCRIQEPTPFSTKWYSHKFKGPGLRYEVALTIKNGEIAWLNERFPCGSHPDL